MVFTRQERVSHTLTCISVVLIYHACFFLSVLIPGYITLYRTGYAIPIVVILIALPSTLLLWRYYCRRYPYLSLGAFVPSAFITGVAASTVLAVVWQYLGVEEEWIISLRYYPASAQWCLMLAACLIAPFCEETIFRGFLLNTFIGWGAYAKYAGIVITSLIFALLHTQYHHPVTFAWIFSFSALLCVIRIETRGLMVPIILHMLNNTAVMAWHLNASTA